MEEQKEMTVREAGIRYGIIMGFATTIISIVIIMIGLAGNRWVQWLSWGITIAIIVLSHNYFKKEGNGYMSYGQGLQIATLSGVVGGLIFSIIMYFYVVFIDSSSIDMIQDLQRQEMESKNLSQEQIDRSLKFFSSFMKPEIIYPIAFLANIFMCFIFSLIISIFTKNQDPALEL